MLGDQIYADATAGVIDAEDRLEKYTSRYYEAFDAPGFRRLARRLPLYMSGDDHEIRDNWPKDSVPPGAAEEMKALFTRVERWAGQLFLAHQRSHGPDQPPWAPQRDGAKFWYAFEAGGLPFFCFDTRFERRRDTERMMESYQLDCFRAWLAMACAGPNPLAPKFILSGSVFAPTEREFAGRPAHARRSDDWAGYPAERSIVLHEIMAQGAQNVVFVSGDLHCGAVASLHFPGNGLRCYAVVAPPFYAPFPFANTAAAEVAGVEAIESIDRQGHLISVECRARSFDAGGFARIAVEPPRGSDALDWEIVVEYCADDWDANGRVTTIPRQTARLAGGEVSLGGTSTPASAL
jgi:alkaline phosphatase D